MNTPRKSLVMTKRFATILILVLICSSSQTVSAQTANSWINVSPAGEQFTVQMNLRENKLKPRGRELS